VIRYGSYRVVHTVGCTSFPVLHVRDAALDGETTALGEGDAGVAECIRRVVARGCEWLVYEGDPDYDSPDDARALMAGALA